MTMNRLSAADCCYGGALLTMPLAGVGVLHLVTGEDIGAGLQPAYLCIAFAWLLRLGDSVRRRAAAGRASERGRARRSGWWAWSLTGFGVVLLSLLGLKVAPTLLLPQEALPRFGKQFVQLGVMAAFLLYPALWTRGPRRWRWTKRLLGWSVGLQLAYAVLQGVHAVYAVPGFALLERAATSNPAILSGSKWLYLGGFTEIPRLRGTMCEPLYLGNLLIGCLPVLVWSGRKRLALGCGIVLLLTWARGAWVAAIGAGLIWALLRRRAALPGMPRRPLWLAAAVLGAGLLTLAAVGGPSQLSLPAQRLLQTLDQGDWSNLTRFYSWQAAWRAWLSSPLVGVGWGQYPYHFYALVALPGLASQFTWPVVNSFPLLVLCELGLAGFGWLAAAVCLLWRRTWRLLGSAATPAADRMRLVAHAAGCIGIWLHLLVFSQYNLPHLWILPGLWLAAVAESGAKSRTRGETG